MDQTCHFKNATILIIKNGNGKNFIIEQFNAAYEKKLVSFKDVKSSETNKTGMGPIIQLIFHLIYKLF